MARKLLILASREPIPDRLLAAGAIVSASFPFACALPFQFALALLLPNMLQPSINTFASAL